MILRETETFVTLAQPCDRIFIATAYPSSGMSASHKHWSNSSLTAPRYLCRHESHERNFQWSMMKHHLMMPWLHVI